MSADFSLHDWLKDRYRPDDYPHFPELQCADGFRFSCQGSAGHYCSPREEFDESRPYSAVEIGFPSSVAAEILPFAEDAGNPTETVYAYVPVSVVENLVQSHGGVKP